MFARTKGSTDPKIRSHDPSKTVVTAINSSTSSSMDHINRPHPDSEGDAWRPGFFRQFPWLGVAAISVNLICTIIAIVVLKLSDNSEIDSWPSGFQPPVWLSTTSTISGLALGLALSQGITVAFWRRILRGTNLEDLHRSYGEGASFLNAVSGLFHAMTHPRSSTLALACILTTLASARGPIIQRALSVSTILDQQYGNMSIRAAQALTESDIYYGIVTGRTDDVQYISPDFTSVVLDFINLKDISIEAGRCGDNCTTTIKGFGFNSLCSFKDVPIPAIVDDPTTASDDLARGREEHTLFNVTVSVEPTNQDYLNGTIILNVTIMKDTQTYRYHQCNLSSATMEYPVFIQDGKVSLQGASKSDKLIQHLPLSVPGLGGLTESSVLGGFQFFLNSQFASSASVKHESIGVNAYTNKGLLTTSYVSFNLRSVNVTDPMPDLLEKVRELAFRAAVSLPFSDNNPANYTQTVAYTGNQSKTIYKSNFAIMGAAVALNFLGVFAVSVLFWGWWRFGRKVSMSPLEIANAFDAPLLDCVHGNATEVQIRKRVGNMRITYAEEIEGEKVRGEGSGARLRFLHHHE